MTGYYDYPALPTTLWEQSAGCNLLLDQPARQGSKGLAHPQPSFVCPIRESLLLRTWYPPCAAERNRTFTTRFSVAYTHQLYDNGIQSQRKDLNLQPSLYRSVALPLSYIGVCYLFSLLPDKQQTGCSFRKAV